MNGSTSPLPGWQLPSIESVLEYEEPDRNVDTLDRARSSAIESVLIALNIPGKIVEILHGPSINWFGIEFDSVRGRDGAIAKVRTKKINDLSIDIAIALSVPYVQIEAPISGKDFIAIGVPKDEFLPINLRDIINSEGFDRIDGPLRFGLGVDIYGNPVSCNLAQFPHLLISGTTNSGKSVCVNAILACLLLNNTPEDLRLILIDSKRVEMVNYNGIPHLLSPVIVEMEHVIGALLWVSREIDKRSQRFTQIGARNIQDYNTHMRSQSNGILPYVLIVIDEVADLMMVSRDENEQLIARITQTGHLTGVHVILTTHRPSVDVISSFVKSNFPARIAFSVTSTSDSRLILGQPGAEGLVGRGDMLFLTQELIEPLHIQGVYVRDSEQERLLNFWKNMGQ